MNDILWIFCVSCEIPYKNYRILFPLKKKDPTTINEFLSICGNIHPLNFLHPTILFYSI